jgi:hypothetical protein
MDGKKAWNQAGDGGEDAETGQGHNQGRGEGGQKKAKVLEAAVGFSLLLRASPFHLAFSIRCKPKSKGKGPAKAAQRQGQNVPTE